jgi:hypothetical protein
VCYATRYLRMEKKQNVHILAVSRKENDLNETLEPLCTIGPISLESLIIDKDIEKFLRISFLLIES